jgi:hypothetical protein
MSAREAFKKLVDDAKDAWVDHTVTFDEFIGLCRDLSTAATTIKDADAKEGLLEATGQVFDYMAAKYDIPFVPDRLERVVEGYFKADILKMVGNWYDNAVGPPHAG